MADPILRVQKLQARVALPTRAYEGSAALDISAFLVTEQGHPYTLTVAPGTVKLIPTGLAMQPPNGHVILVCSRSGLGARGIFVANAPGVVDPDYTGELKVELFNGSHEPHYVKNGDRIAQLLIVPFSSPGLFLVDKLSTTERGARGFGSSGD